MFNQTVLQNALYGEHVKTVAREHVKYSGIFWQWQQTSSSGNNRQNDAHADNGQCDEYDEYVAHN